MNLSNEKKEFWSMLGALVFGLVMLTIEMGIVFRFTFGLNQAMIKTNDFSMFPFIISIGIFIAGFYGYALVREYQEKFLATQKDKIWVSIVLTLVPPAIIYFLFPNTLGVNSNIVFSGGFLALSLIYAIAYGIRKQILKKKSYVVKN